VLANLRKGDTFADLAAGFGTATAWRYVTETVALLAARSPKLPRALAQAKNAGHVYVVADGTLIPIDRVAAGRPFYSGKHRHHGMNLQVISPRRRDPVGLWPAGRGHPRPDRGPDLSIVRELVASGLVVLADKGYASACDHVRIPVPGPGQARLPERRQPCLVGAANAQLKSWRILRKLRCCPWRAGQLAKSHPHSSSLRDPRMKHAH
jgi:hypothetical protein